MRSVSTFVAGAMLGGALLTLPSDAPKIESFSTASGVESPFDCLGNRGDILSLQIEIGGLATQICEISDEINDYWETEGRLDIAVVPIYLHTSEQSTSCTTGEYVGVYTGEEEFGRFCDVENTFVVSAKSLTYRHEPGDTDDTKEASLWFTVSHEVGHGVQAHGGADFDYPDQGFSIYAQRLEREADCLAGNGMSQTAPELVDEAELVLDRYNRTPFHGSPDQRRLAFRYGAIRQNCDPETLEAVGIIPSLPVG